MLKKWNLEGLGQPQAAFGLGSACTFLSVEMVYQTLDKCEINSEVYKEAVKNVRKIYENIPRHAADVVNLDPKYKNTFDIDTTTGNGFLFIQKTGQRSTHVKTALANALDIVNNTGATISYGMITSAIIFLNNKYILFDSHGCSKISQAYMITCDTLDDVVSALYQVSWENKNLPDSITKDHVSEIYQYSVSVIGFRKKNAKPEVVEIPVQNTRPSEKVENIPKNSDILRKIAYVFIRFGVIIETANILSLCYKTVDYELQSVKSAVNNNQLLSAIRSTDFMAVFNEHICFLIKQQDMYEFTLYDTILFITKFNSRTDESKHFGDTENFNFICAQYFAQPLNVNKLLELDEYLLKSDL